MITAGIFLLVLFGLLAIGAPIAFTMAIVGSIGLFATGGIDAVYTILASKPLESVAVYEFVTIPMFLLMAEFVLRSGVADELFEAAAAWVGRIPGGLGVATAFAGAGFGAICGSSTASAATLSATSLPSMIRHGYEPRIAAGVVSISGTLAMMIPPSIAMVVYGLIADVNIGRLLLAGVVPGIIVTLTIMATVYVLVKMDPSRAPTPPAVPLAEKLRLASKIGPIILLFGTVTGAIYTGIATPTESSAIGACAAAIIYFARARRSWADVSDLIGRATRTSCMVALILFGAHLFSTFFALTQVAQGLITWIGSLDVQPWVVIMVLVLMYLVLGFFMDQMAILVLTVPIVAPLVSSLGYDLVWFGVIKIVVAELGMVTPPLGLNCFVVAKYSKTPISDVFHGTFPHVIAHFVAIAVLLFFPQLTLWLPNQMG
jgi:tripartite ATP-independent transporter DctM subunit